MSKVAAAQVSVPPAIVKYMQELELLLKQMAGVSPEEALGDAREFLLADYDALLRSGEAPAPASHYDWIVEHFGSPSRVAAQYGTIVDPPPGAERSGYAPGWRICCKHCGRSAPYARTGAIRVGARSYHKYILGYCRNCQRLRWCRLIQDLNQTNLTQQLCDNLDISPEELREQMHISVVKMIGGILLLVVAINAIVWLALNLLR